MRSLTLLIVLLFVSCRFSEPEMTLLSPISEYDGRLDSINFDWISTAKGTRNLVVAEDANFEKLVLDIETEFDFFIAPEFRPNKEYYWKVETNKISAESSFKTIDPMVEIFGEYEAETEIINWSLPSRRNVRTIFETVSLIEENEGIRIEHGGGLVNKNCYFDKYLDDEYRYGTSYNTYTNGSDVIINRLTREVELNSRLGGRGSGVVYITKFNY